MRGEGLSHMLSLLPSPGAFLGEPVMVDLVTALLNAALALAHGTAIMPPVCG